MSGAILFLAVGLLATLISLWMVVNPSDYAARVLDFSEWRWFHSFEIVSRLLLGAAFVALSDAFLYPVFATYLGYLLFAVAVFLVLLRSSRHRRFARFIATLAGPVVRAAGVVGTVLGVLLTYLAAQSM